MPVDLLLVLCPLLPPTPFAAAEAWPVALVRGWTWPTLLDPLAQLAPWLAWRGALAQLATSSGWPTLLALAPLLYVAVATPFLVVFDVRHRRLPNVIVLPGLGVVAGCAAAAAPLAHTDPGGTALVAGVTLLVFAAFRVAGALASGDVKLAALLASALAPLASASLTLYALAGSTAALTSGLAALLVLARARHSAHHRARHRHRGPRGIPLGPFLLLGFWVAVAAALLLPLT